MDRPRGEFRAGPESHRQFHTLFEAIWIGMPKVPAPGGQRDESRPITSRVKRCVDIM